MIDSMAIHAKLHALHVKSGLSYAKVAQKSDVPESTVKRILNGTTLNPPAATVIAITYAMGGTISDIFDEDTVLNLDPNNPTVTYEMRPLTQQEVLKSIATTFSPVKFAIIASVMPLEDADCIDILRHLTAITAEKAAIQKEKEN